tara:strand:+ start:2537 stop:3661 length:1125 start_codon:yes stop_codon:yes gene_type:complete
MKRYITIILLTATMIQSCGNKTEVTETTEETTNEIVISKKQFEYNKMTIGSLEMQSFNTTVQTTGQIDVPPQNKVLVNAKMGGFIKSTPLLLGDYVEKGATLVIIENPEFIQLQQQYLEHKQQIKYLEAEYNRQKTLNNEQIASDKNFLKSESDYKSTLATFKGLEKTLSLIGVSSQSLTEENISSSARITAPISGNISSLNVTTGSYVSATDPILEITNADHMHLELEVFEKDAMKIKKGQQIMFTIPESGETEYPAEVHLVSKTIDANQRTVRVHGHISDSIHSNFAVGMFVSASISVAQKELTALPISSISEAGNQTYVLVLSNTDEENYYFTQKKVSILEKSGQHVALDLVNDNNQYLTNGIYSLIQEEE